MTLDEAIKHAEEVADTCEYEASKYDISDSYESYVACQEGECGEQHRQLAEWLKDYKQLKEQQSNEDCVSRQAVLERINDWWGITLTSGEPSLCDCIRELPSVTPTQKVGYWIDSEILGEFKCSCCGNYWQDAEENEYEDWVNIAKFCPVCGAEMVSENKKNCNNCTHRTDADEIHGITPCGSCGIDLKNFKQKTEMKDTCEQEKNNKESIPYLMHKEMDIPLLECQKAYDVAIDYLRSQAKVKG